MTLHEFYKYIYFTKLLNSESNCNFLRFMTGSNLFIDAAKVFFFYFFLSMTDHCIHWKKKWSHFDLKNWVTGGTKIRPGILSTWRIFESNWLDVERKFDSILRVNLIRYWDSIWFDIEIQFDSNIESQFDSNIVQFLGIPGRILVPPVTQLFGSKWFHFFFQYRLSCNIAASHSPRRNNNSSRREGAFFKPRDYRNGFCDALHLATVLQHTCEATLLVKISQYMEALACYSASQIHEVKYS